MTVSVKSRKVLWVESGGRCAICRKPLLTTTDAGEPSVSGDEAHIVPRRPRGPRSEGRGGMTPAEIDDHSNLILLCKPDHKQVDDYPERFPVEDLRRLKQEHRAWVLSLGSDKRQPAGQAEKVSAWPHVVAANPSAAESPPAWGALIRNGSDLPVYQVHVEFLPIDPWHGSYVVVIELVPPGDWLVSGRKVYPKPESAGSRPDIWELPDRTFVVELRFADSNGRVWRRSRDGVLTPEARR